jgi:hypothetical protein
VVVLHWGILHVHLQGGVPVSKLREAVTHAQALVVGHVGHVPSLGARGEAVLLEVRQHGLLESELHGEDVFDFQGALFNSLKITQR